LELFGLYRVLRSWRLYIIGVTNFQVEVDVKFIQGLLNNPDLQLDAAVNRWIQGILMFHFELIHVPAVRFQGPDTLSQRGMVERETAEDDDDTWLDRITLLTQQTPTSVFQPISTPAKPEYYRLPKVTFTGQNQSHHDEGMDVFSL
jgi:hypothetical protein